MPSHQLCTWLHDRYSSSVLPDAGLARRDCGVRTRPDIPAAPSSLSSLPTPPPPPCSQRRHQCAARCQWCRVCAVVCTVQLSSREAANCAMSVSRTEEGASPGHYGATLTSAAPVEGLKTQDTDTTETGECCHSLFCCVIGYLLICGHCKLLQTVLS